MLVRDLAAGEEPDQGHITQRMAHDLQLGAGDAKVRAASARATDVDRTGNPPCRVGRGLGQLFDMLELSALSVEDGALRLQVKLPPLMMP